MISQFSTAASEFPVYSAIFLIIDQNSKKILSILESSSLTDIKYQATIYNCEVAIYKLLLPAIGSNFEITDTVQYMRIG